VESSHTTMFCYNIQYVAVLSGDYGVKLLPVHCFSIKNKRQTYSKDSYLHISGVVLYVLATGYCILYCSLSTFKFWPTSSLHYFWDRLVWQV